MGISNFEKARLRLRGSLIERTVDIDTPLGLAKEMSHGILIENGKLINYGK